MIACPTAPKWRMADGGIITRQVTKVGEGGHGAMFGERRCISALAHAKQISLTENCDGRHVPRPSAYGIFKSVAATPTRASA